MYSLLMSGKTDLWDRSPASFPADRIFEHTIGELRKRFGDLEPPALDELLECPALFAYESMVGRDARVGRIIRIRKRSRADAVRIEFELDPEIAPITPDNLEAMAWELDINDWEYNRTHWAIKDVDLLEELHGSGLFDPAQFVRTKPKPAPDLLELHIEPKIFRVPSGSMEKDLVSVMRPFKPEFDPVMKALENACEGVSMRCLDVNMEWVESEIIQDIFSLIFRSSVVICDFSEKNPNVFYEAGIAHTLGRSVIPIVQDSADIPFDLVHHRYLKYEPGVDGLRRLTEGVSKRLQALVASKR